MFRTLGAQRHLERAFQLAALQVVRGQHVGGGEAARVACIGAHLERGNDGGFVATGIAQDLEHLLAREAIGARVRARVGKVFVHGALGIARLLVQIRDVE